MNTLAQDLFTRALELPEAEREAFLSEACGDDAELHLEVQRMLVDSARADAFFADEDDATIGAEDFEGGYSEKEGDVIGPYKLRQKIGEGGFGTVWMAEQSEPISRMVALKVIKAGMDTKQVLARFAAERQAVAMMDHPNIAKVLDAGATTTGRPFFVMELVKGIPITEYCNEAGSSTTERLALFGDVCSAINHAHQKGIIHRDIKPSNVMVTLHGDKPVVKVIDFGIAKATQGKLTDQTLFTRFEQMVGTPAYMSPEQAGLSGLDIDTRSDIYGLGILLYELLVGKTPFDAKTLISAGYEEMRRIIREVEPVKPSSRLSTVQGEERTHLAKSHRIEEGKLGKLIEPDLDWIVMKAIDKDRSRRYETANAFAQDIVRFLSDEPVTATPPSTGYQFKKFARRNKAAFRVAALITAVLVVATAVSSWQAVRATRAERVQAQLREKSEVNEQQAIAQAERATKAEQRAIETLKEVAAERDAKEKARKEAEVISAYISDFLQSPDPTRDGRTITVAETLDTAAKKLETELASQPETRAKLQASLGKTYFSLGLELQAIPLQEKVLDYYMKTYGREHSSTISAISSVASSYERSRRRVEAPKLREEVLALRRKTLGPEHPETVSAMANLAASYFRTQRIDEAFKMTEEVLELSRKVNGPEHPVTINAMENLASCYAYNYHNLKNLGEALKLREVVLELRRRILGPEHPDTLMAMLNLAASYPYTSGDKALKMREEALELSRKVNGSAHYITIQALDGLADLYRRIGRKEEALKLEEEKLESMREKNGQNDPSAPMWMLGLAIHYRVAGRNDEALKLIEEALALHRKIKGPENTSSLSLMNQLAEVQEITGRKEDAAKLRDEVVELGRKLFDRELKENERRGLHAQMNAAADYYEKTGRKDEAVELRKELEKVPVKQPITEQQTALKDKVDQAIDSHRKGRKDEAVKILEEVLPLSRKVNGPEHPDTLKAMGELVNCYGATGRNDDAFKLREELVPLFRKVKGPRDPGLLWAAYMLAINYQAAGRLEEALKLSEEALAMARNINGPEDKFTLKLMNQLAEIQDQLGRKDEAAKLRAEVETIKAKKK